MTNLVVGVHGMIPERGPVDAARDMERLHSVIFDAKHGPPPHTFLSVSWGHEPKGAPLGTLRSDQKLTKAQSNIARHVVYDKVKTARSANNRVRLDVLEIPFIRKTKDTVALFGLPDVIYYCSADGETAVRKTLCTQVLTAVENIRKENGNGPVRLHFIAHSLGGAVVHDLLFNVFGIGRGVKAFSDLRKLKDTGELFLGSLITIETQLPLFMMRKQRLVNIYYGGGLLDFANIGLNGPLQDRYRWLNIYERDDLLGFPATGLYRDPHKIALQYQAKASWNPASAHILKTYVRNRACVKLIRSVLFANM